MSNDQGQGCPAQREMGPAACIDRLGSLVKKAAIVGTPALYRLDGQVVLFVPDDAFDRLSGYEVGFIANRPQGVEIEFVRRGLDAAVVSVDRDRVYVIIPSVKSDLRVVSIGKGGEARTRVVIVLPVTA